MNVGFCPAATVTIIVSPIAREIARINEATMPDIAAGVTIGIKTAPIPKESVASAVLRAPPAIPPRKPPSPAPNALKSSKYVVMPKMKLKDAFLFLKGT